MFYQNVSDPINIIFTVFLLLFFSSLIRVWFVANYQPELSALISRKSWKYLGVLVLVWFSIIIVNNNFGEMLGHAITDYLLLFLVLMNPILLGLMGGHPTSLSFASATFLLGGSFLALFFYWLLIFSIVSLFQKNNVK